MDQNLIIVFENNHGYLQTKHLQNRNLKYLLKNMVDNGEVTMVKRGLYRHNAMVQGMEWEEACHIIPQGVLCLFSAWSYYKLTTQIPSQYHLAIPNKTKVTLPPYPPIKLYYWDNKAYSLGKTEISNQDGKINIYSIEKSVCDAIRFRNKVGIDITTEVLKNYLKHTNRNLDVLLKLAKSLRVENVLNDYLKLML